MFTDGQGRTWVLAEPDLEPEPERAATEPAAQDPEPAPGQWVPVQPDPERVLPPFARQWPEAPPEPIAPAHDVRGLPGLGRGVSN